MHYSNNLIENNISKLQNIIKVKFKEKLLITYAITHRSFANELNNHMNDNERMEYLGDSVLGLIINEYLYKRYENYHEGELAKIKSAVVSEDMLTKIALEIDLGKYILLGKGEELSGGRERPSILANTVEAIIGAIYLDSGLKKAKGFVLSYFKKHIENVEKLPYLRDPKTALQEIVQKKYKKKPVYEVVSEKGPDHKKEFCVKIIINNKEILSSVGPSKRKAEMSAAKKVLRLIDSGEIKI